MIFTHTPSDKKLIRRVLSGDKGAFNVLVARYLSVVQAVAYSYSRNHAAAEDVTQEVFLKAYQTLHNLRDPSCFAGWLTTTTRNMCMEMQRSDKRRREREQASAQRDFI